MEDLDALVRREVKSQVWAAIDALPERERSAVMLFYLGGYVDLTHDEILDRADRVK